MDADEEIIFSHSPFHQYLIDYAAVYGDDKNLDENAIDSAVVRVRKHIDEKDIGSGMLEEQIMDLDRSSLIATKWKESSLLQRFFQRCGFENMYGLDLYYGYRMTDICLKSKQLDEDDARLLQAYKDSFNEESSLTFRQYPHPIRLVAVAVAAISYLIGRIFCCHPIGVSEFVAHRSWHLVFSDVLCGVATIVHLLHFYQFSSRQSKHRRNAECFRKFLKLSNDLFNESKRTIRCLRDREVLHRGFTMVSKQTAVFNGPAMSEIPDKIVRKRFVLSVRQLFLMIRNESIDLAATFPNQLSDSLAGCMYHVQLEDFGKLFAPEFDQLEIDAEFEKEIFSLSALKAAFELLQLQFSEFLRLLCLRLWPSFYHQHERKNYDTISSHLPHILMRLSEPFALNYKQFQRSLVPVTMQAPDVENLRSGFAGNGEISGCAAPVHSLNVHLQLALEKSSVLEENVVQESTFDKEVILLRLQELNTQLTAAQACIDEAMTLLGKKSSEFVRSEIASSSSSTKPVAVEVPSMYSDDGVLLEVDQVFEAVAGETVFDDSNQECTFEEFDLVRKKQETRKLLNEMQHILKARSAQMKDRERKALAQQLNVPLESVELPDWHQPQLNEQGEHSTIEVDNEQSRPTGEFDKRIYGVDSELKSIPDFGANFAAVIAAKSQQFGRQIDLFEDNSESD